MAQYINGKRIAAKFMGAPSPPLYAVGGVEDRSSLRLPWRLLATRFARILKAGRTRGSSASGRFLWWQSRGNSYLLPEPGPAKFENIDQDGLHEAPEDFE